MANCETLTLLMLSWLKGKSLGRIAFVYHNLDAWLLLPNNLKWFLKIHIKNSKDIVFLNEHFQVNSQIPNGYRESSALVTKWGEPTWSIIITLTLVGQLLCNWQYACVFAHLILTTAGKERISTYRYGNVMQLSQIK